MNNYLVMFLGRQGSVIGTTYLIAMGFVLSSWAIYDLLI